MGLPRWHSGKTICLSIKRTWVKSWSGKIPHHAEQLSPRGTTTEPTLQGPRATTTELVLRNKRSHHNEKPTHHNQEQSPTHHKQRQLSKSNGDPVQPKIKYLYMCIQNKLSMYIRIFVSLDKIIFLTSFKSQNYNPYLTLLYISISLLLLP